MEPPELRPLNPRVSPKLDVFLGGSDEVNQGRAEQSPSVAIAPDAPAPPPPAPGEAAAASVQAVAAPVLGAPAVRPVELLPRKTVADLAAESPEDVVPQEVDFSLFVRLDRDLDPETRARAVEAVNSRARRVRWKLDTASVEIPARHVRELSGIDGISYIELGQPLRGPEPIVGGSAARAPGDGRRVTAFETRETNRGLEVSVDARSRGRHTLVVTAG